ncbi:MAG TPA: 2-oxoglutarate dehydrogenase, E2 component, dihydrolipoamide succinyltransferase [Jiangellaceae bacterium]
MATSVTLPALGESVTEGTVTRWLKQPGEQVEADEPLLEISTDKVDTEIPSPVAGTLLEIKVGEDETVEVGAELATIGSADEAPAQDGPDQGAPAQEGSSQAAGSDAAEKQEPADDEEPLLEQRPSAASDAESDQAEDADQAEPPPAGQKPSSGNGTSVTLPALGESVTEGTVTRWLKQVGDEVQADEPLLEISTDKVDTEIPSPVAGTLLEIKVGEDETIEVGAELAVIGSGDGAAAQQPAPAEEAPAKEEPEQAPAEEAPAEVEAEAQKAEPAEKAPAQQAPAAEPTAPQTPPKATEPPARAPEPEAAPAAGNGSPYVTPLVRKLATQHGVDLSTVEGTGVGGRIRKQDVLAAAESAKAPEPQAAPAAATKPSEPEVAPSSLRGTTESLSRLRKVIAARVHEAIQNTAQLTTVIEVDVTAIAQLRDKVKKRFEEREGVKLSFLPFFAKAALEALKEHPKINASIDVEAGTVTYHDTENLVIAVDTDRGLMVPVIHNAGDLNIAGLTKRIADLAERTRSNQLKPDEVAGGTFTLTNTGSRGALFDTPIFFEPQVAILGTGAVVKRPVVVTGELGETIAIRHMMYLALSYDHRLIDGADAARFLATIKQRLEAGQFEGDLGV